MEAKPFSTQPMPIRREEIYRLITDEGLVRVNDLAQRLDVTGMTIRRDLEAMEREGLVERVHGGAVAKNRGQREPLYTQKSILHKREKDAIALAAARMVEDGDTLFINGGSTTLRIFKLLSSQSVKIVTNNAWFPLEDMPRNLEIIATGGTFRRETFTFVGDIAVKTVKQVYANKVFIGLEGFDLQCGITSPSQEESQINRAMIEQARGKVVVVADSSKIGKVSSFFVAPASSVTTLITDSGIRREDREAFEKAGIEVVVC